MRNIDRIGLITKVFDTELSSILFNNNNRVQKE